MTLLYLLLTSFLPIVLGYRLSKKELKDNGRVRHGLVLAYVTVFWVGSCYVAALADPERSWWRYAVPAVACYWAFYPIVINRLLLKVGWNYIGTTSVYDRFERWMRSWLSEPGVLGLKLMGLLTGLWAWIYGSIY